jgi:ribose-phosphate pyrophosphokinase
VSNLLFFAMPGNEAMAQSLAAGCGGEIGELEARDFPDGETYLRFRTDPSGHRAVLVCTLAHPNQKFLPLAFAAAAARDMGAMQVGLVAPYLSYMRQDCRFHGGEAVTSRHFAALISRNFDWLITIAPHLHRYSSLDQIYSIPSRVVRAEEAIAEWIKAHIGSPFMIGPDEESAQWVSRVALGCGARFAILSKTRLGDRNVHLKPEDLSAIGSATPVLLDDLISTGETMLAAIDALRRFTDRQPIVIAVHGLFAGGADVHLISRGVRLVTCDTIPHPSNGIKVVPLMAPAILELSFGQISD